MSLGAKHSRMQSSDLDKRLEPVMIALALATIPLLLLETLSASDAVAVFVYFANTLIWVAFTAEFLVMLVRSTSKRQYITSHWLDLVIILLTPPIFVPSALQSLRSFRALRAVRVFRFARLMRVVRAALFASRAFRGLKKLATKHSLHYVTLSAVVLILFGAVMLMLIEPQTVGGLGDAIWWAITTTTTVGYGDISPITPAGRLLASIVMIIGIGLVAIITANFASYFVGQEESDTLDAILAELKDLRAEVHDLKQKLGDAESQFLSRK